MTIESLPSMDGPERPISVYILVFPNGKSYVGVSRDMHARATEHQARANAGSRYALSCAIRKYGMPKPMIVAKVPTYEEAFAIEAGLIERRKTRAPNGYNMTAGGEGVVGLTAAQLRKIGRDRSKVYRQRWADDPDFRRRMTDIYARAGRKISAVNKAFYATAEGQALLARRASSQWREKVAAANRRPKLPETLAKMSAQLKARWQDPVYRQKVNAAREARQAELRASNPEWKAARAAKTAATMRRKWKDPEYLAKMEARGRAPDVKEKLAAGGRKGAAALTEAGRERKRAASRAAMTALWSTPSFRSKMLASMSRRRQASKSSAT